MNAARWIRTSDELAEFVRSLADAPAVALDTESDSFHHYHEKVCLLQLADSSGNVSLLDPLVLKNLSSFRPVASDPAVEKVLHGGEYDVALMKRDFGFAFVRLFDTQIAARFIGRTAFGLQSLLEHEFGVRLSKSSQRDDWSRRPLSPAQEKYAAEDVRHLMALRDRLVKELRELGREGWVREECDALAEVAASVDREPADCLSVKGARDLSRRELAILRELFTDREAWARDLDRPLFKLVGDEALVLLARRRPRDPRALDSLGGLSPYVRRRYGRDLVDAIRRGESVPEAQCPRHHRGSGKRMSFEGSQRVDRIKAWRAQAAARSNLDPGLLLPQRLIERIAIEAPRSLEALEKFPGIRRWRVENFGEGIVKAVKG